MGLGTTVAWDRVGGFSDHWHAIDRTPSRRPASGGNRTTRDVALRRVTLRPSMRREDDLRWRSEGRSGHARTAHLHGVPRGDGAAQPRGADVVRARQDDVRHALGERAPRATSSPTCGAQHHRARSRSSSTPSLIATSGRPMSAAAAGSVFDSTSRVDWDEVAGVCEEAYRTVAPKRLVAALDDRKASDARAPSHVARPPAKRVARSPYSMVMRTRQRRSRSIAARNSAQSGCSPCTDAIQLDESVHRLGQVDDLGRAVDLHPLTEELIRQDAQRRPRVTPEVLGLGPINSHADRHPALGVSRTDDRRGLQPIARSARGQHGAMVRAERTQLSRPASCVDATRDLLR